MILANGVRVIPTDKTQCECCNNTSDKCQSVGTIIMCPDCFAKDQALMIQSIAEAPARLEILNSAARRIEPIGNIAEYFNNKTTSIVEYRKQIDADETIKDKPWHEAQELMNWLNESKKNLFNLKKQEEVEVANQNAIQVRLNTLANNLRAEQREQLKLANVNYKPAEVTKAKAPKVSKPKAFDKVAIDEACKKYNIPAAVLQTICVAFKEDVDSAVKRYMASKG